MLCEGENKTLIYISQKDIREFQLAKAAIYTGIKILLKILKIEKDEVEEFLVAGAFGNYMNVQNAYSVGLFPFFPRAQVRTVGNAANFGAIIALLSQDSRREAERIPSLVHPIELANSSDFQDTLIESMSFSDVN